MSDLTPLLSTADLWLHGHVHDSFNYEVDGCRVVANPAGYVRNFLTADTDKELKFENTRFSPRLVLDIAKRSV